MSTVKTAVFDKTRDEAICANYCCKRDNDSDRSRQQNSTWSTQSIDDHIVAASAGHAADGRQLVELARQQAQKERLQYDEPITVRTLVTAIGDHIQEHTLAGGVRPYGSSLLIGGYDDGPALFELDPSGSVIEWKASAVGGNKENIVPFLEEEYQSEMTQQDALSIAIEGLELLEEETSSGKFAAGIIGKDGYLSVSDDQIGSMLSGS